jgi:hypothetical protein
MDRAQRNVYLVIVLGVVGSACFWVGRHGPLRAQPVALRSAKGSSSSSVPQKLTGQQFIEKVQNDSSLGELATSFEHFDGPARYLMITSWCEDRYGNDWARMDADGHTTAVNQINATIKGLLAERDFQDPN